MQSTPKTEMDAWRTSAGIPETVAFAPPSIVGSNQYGWSAGGDDVATPKIMTATSRPRTKRKRKKVRTSTSSFNNKRKPEPKQRQYVEKTDLDVLAGRGSGSADHPGNQWYRSLVESQKPEYKSRQKMGKTSLAREIMLKVQTRGGRFLVEETDGTGRWYIAHETAAREKISAALRQDNTNLSSVVKTKAKNQPRKQQPSTRKQPGKEIAKKKEGKGNVSDKNKKGKKSAKRKTK